MLKKIALATALVATFGTAHAYQTEIGGTIALVDPDHADTSTGFAIDGAYYFNPVQIKNSPLNEAAFLNRASNVNAGVSYFDYDNYDVTSFGVGIEYYIPNSDFYVSGNIGQVSEDTPLGDFDTTVYGAELGYLPAPGLLVALGLQGYDDDAGDDVDPTLRAKYVTQVGNYDMNFEGGVVFADDEEFNLGADVYLDKTFSVGLGYTDDGFDDAFQIRAKKFFTQQVSVEGSVNFADDENIFAVRGAYRF